MHKPEDDELEDSPEVMREKGEEISNMYDDSPEAGQNGLYGLGLREGLTEYELKLAPLYASLSRGMMVISGPPGSGKGTFFNVARGRSLTIWRGKTADSLKPKRSFWIISPAGCSTWAWKITAISSSTPTSWYPKWIRWP